MKKEYIILLISGIVVILVTLCSLIVLGVSLLYGFTITSQVPPVNISNNNCGLETCHGLDVKCGSSPAMMCTEMYTLGDKCLKYVQCGNVNGECGQIKNEKFDSCKSCVQDCMNKYSDAESQFQCESLCE